MTSISLKYTKKITRELLGDVKHKDHMGDQMRKTEQLLYMEKTKFVQSGRHHKADKGMNPGNLQTLYKWATYFTLNQ